MVDSSMVPEVGNNFILYSTVTEIWKAIKELYSKRDNVSEIYELEAQLQEIRKGDGSISMYYSNLTRLWQEIDMFEEHTWTSPADDRSLKQFIETKGIFWFLHGLNKELDQVRSRVLGTKPPSSLNSVFSKVRQEESRIKVMMENTNTSVNEGSALLANSSTQNSNIPPVTTQTSIQKASSCTNLGFTSLVAKRNQGTGQRFPYRPPQYCKYCKKNGHSVDNYFKLQRLKQSQQQNGHPRFQPSWGTQRKSMANTVSNQDGQGQESRLTHQVEALVQLLTQQHQISGNAQHAHAESQPIQATMASMEGTRSNDVGCSWIIDSGASDHMTNNLTLLNSYKVFTLPRVVRIANGINLKVLGRGEVRLADILILRDVLHVPHLRFNLIFVSKITQDNHCLAVFSSSECLF